MLQAPPRPGFNAGLGHVSFVLDGVALGPGFLRVLVFTAVVIIYSIFTHNRKSTYLD
jgi:hypothetical protein